MHRFIRGKSGPKFGNKKTEVDGHKFDSKKEAKRYGELKQLENAGKIKNLVLHPRFVLQEAFQDARAGLTKAGKPKTVGGIVYNGDFQYEENGRVVVEDVKSPFTRKDPRYSIKKRLFLARYRDVDFREV